MWIIPKNLPAYRYAQDMGVLCVLVFSGRKEMSMFAFGVKFKVFNIVVGFIAIFVVYIIILGNFAVGVFPYEAV